MNSVVENSVNSLAIDLTNPAPNILVNKINKDCKITKMFEDTANSRSMYVPLPPPPLPEWLTPS